MNLNFRIKIIVSLLFLIISSATFGIEQSLSNGVKDIASEIASEFKNNSNVIIVSSFLKVSGEENELGNIISEELITALYRTKKFSIVERSMLNRIMKEQEFQIKGITDSTNAAKLGKILGASAICTGTFSDYGTYIKLNARIIESESGRIIAASSSEISKEAYMNAFLKTNSTVDVNSDRAEDVVTQSSDYNKENILTTESTKNSFQSSELFTLMQSASVSNIPSAQFKLGYMYYYGEGVELDYKKAYSWFEKSAGNENIEAMSWMGYMNMFGYGKEIDYASAKFWFLKAADYNDSYSETKLGEIYFNGNGVTSDYYTAFKWFKKAADKSNKLAMSWIGYCYESGYGCPQSYKNAYSWYLKSADLYDNYSENKIGEFYYNGYFVQKDLKKAFEWFDRSAKNGSSKASSWLGYMYREGISVSKDISSAIKYFEDAANYNDSYSQRQLGDIYFNGDGVTLDYYTAFNWFSKAADNGDVTSQSWLGYMYRYGYGTNIDYVKSFDWFSKAADADDGYSNYILGDIYDSGMGNIKSNQKKAQEYYKKALNLGYTDAEKRIKK